MAQLFEANGYTLIICRTMENGQEGIEVKASNCPTQDCVHTGVITQAGESIVCLPARLSIQLQGSKQPDTVDAVLG